MTNTRAPKNPLTRYKLSAKDFSAATMLKVYLKSFLLSLVVFHAGVAQAAEALQFPLFRHIDRSAPAPKVTLPNTLVLLADEDFAPFSFKTADGRLNGISVDLALAACGELKVQCSVKTLPFAGLLPALQAKQGNLVIAGPVANPQTAAAFAASKPYYLSFSVFVMRNSTNLPGADEKSLAGRRIGFVKGSQQEVFLKKHYERSNLIPFSSTGALFEALRTSGLDLAFADSLQAAFWLKGSDAHECCSPFGQAFVDRSTFTHGLVMMTRIEDAGLRDAFDFALDELQDKGVTAKILSSYLPVSPF